METHRKYFPSSSSSSPSPSAPRATTQAFDNFHGHGHMMSSSSSGGGRGFHLGFMDNHNPTTPAENKSDLVYDGCVIGPNRAQVKEVSQVMGSEDIDDKGLVINGKKAEKKKIRKPRFAFQTRSQVDILDDGYRWRKYGQKAVENNKFPRSYYRCTQQGCNVKKQVQRLTKDEGVVVTTYEGMHTHPIDKPTDNFEHILSQMQVYTPF